VNNILTKYRDEAKKNYEQNGFASYLSGAMWEADHKWDDAYISYKDAYKQLGDKKIIEKDLIRSSKEAQRPDDYAMWKGKFKETSIRDAVANPNDGELVFIYQQGRGPVKKPNPNFPRIPKLYPQKTEADRARIFINGQNPHDTEMLYSVTDIAIKTLDDQYAGLIAKRVGGIVAKYAVSETIAKKNEALGFLTWIGLNLADRADLRQWSTLPGTLQVARISLPAGDYDVTAQSVDAQGVLISEKMKSTKIKIVPKKKVFLTWRSYS
jgi:hypothetical protein